MKQVRESEKVKANNNESDAGTPAPVTIHYCMQCGKDMGYEWILGAVCGKCVRANHKKVCGKR